MPSMPSRLSEPARREHRVHGAAGGHPRSRRRAWPGRPSTCVGHLVQGQARVAPSTAVDVGAGRQEGAHLGEGLVLVQRVVAGSTVGVPCTRSKRRKASELPITLFGRELATHRADRLALVTCDDLALARPVQGVRLQLVPEDEGQHDHEHHHRRPAPTRRRRRRRRRSRGGRTVLGPRAAVTARGLVPAAVGATRLSGSRPRPRRSSRRRLRRPPPPGSSARSRRPARPAAAPWPPRCRRPSAPPARCGRPRSASAAPRPW